MDVNAMNSERKNVLRIYLESIMYRDYELDKNVVKLMIDSGADLNKKINSSCNYFDLENSIVLGVKKRSFSDETILGFVISRWNEKDIEKSEAII